MKFPPTNTAEKEYEKEAFEEMLEDYGKNIFHLHPSMRVLKFLRTMRLIDYK